MSAPYFNGFCNRGTLIAFIGGALAIALGAVFLHQGKAVPAPTLVPSAAGDIVGRARIEPSGRVIVITGPVDGTVTVIRKLLVDQGSQLETGQVLAVLDQFESRQANLAVSQHNLQLAELQLAQVTAGAKFADIAAQANVITAKQAQLLRLQTQWARSSALYRQSFVSKQALDQLKADLDQGKSEVSQAVNALKSLTEVRSVDQQVAAAQVEVAKATVALSRAEMERAEILAPGPGTVLSIQARAGEAIQADGVLRMADLSHLIAVAEIDEAKAGLVTEGMTAEIDGNLLPHPIRASVTRVAREVFRQKRPSSDVLIGRDARIVEIELTPNTPLPPVVGGEVMVHLLPARTAER
ncbi:MAG: Secretion protein HlyD [Rhodospirillales bacterium]|nr:Secretion protein HlyD [Rhodospirillales bacterium]